MSLDISARAKDTTQKSDASNHAKNSPASAPITDSKLRFKALMLKKSAQPKMSLPEKRPVVQLVVDKSTLKLPPPPEKLSPKKNCHEMLDLSTQMASLGSAAIPHERLIEQNMGVVAHMRSSSDEEINKLIKQLAASFSAKKNESRFSIAHGIFKGADFQLVTSGGNLTLNIQSASSSARALLNEHRKILSDRLQKHEINLVDLQFLS